eukprot:TRINITY_DN2729_c0_g1_i1.p1 TRINITY_DN2729_c0_g1~~TRINITY_DN2729_c0_g1_i1.p1  ORF type:complete len:266 (-),score=59.70 TRINITY_DN2729_c0_g1_i1:42-839(-)
MMTRDDARRLARSSHAVMLEASLHGSDHPSNAPRAFSTQALLMAGRSSPSLNSARRHMTLSTPASPCPPLNQHLTAEQLQGQGQQQLELQQRLRAVQRDQARWGTPEQQQQSLAPTPPLVPADLRPVGPASSTSQMQSRPAVQQWLLDQQRQAASAMPWMSWMVPAARRAPLPLYHPPVRRSAPPWRSGAVGKNAQQKSQPEQQPQQQQKPQQAPAQQQQPESQELQERQELQTIVQRPVEALQQEVHEEQSAVQALPQQVLQPQ